MNILPVYAGSVPHYASAEGHLHPQSVKKPAENEPKTDFPCRQNSRFTAFSTQVSGFMMLKIDKTLCFCPSIYLPDTSWKI
jgi:hypothetical protein